MEAWHGYLAGVRSVPSQVFFRHYHEAINRYNFGLWVNRVPFAPHKELFFSLETLQALERACQAHLLTKGNALDEDSACFEPLLALLATRIDTALTAAPYTRAFVRTGSCSLKDAPGGLCAFSEGSAVVRAMVASARVHTAVDAALRHGDVQDWESEEAFMRAFGVSLYVLEWRELAKEDEFRVFVHRGRVTAISQYGWFSGNRWWHRRYLLPEVVRAIIAFADATVPQAGFESCVMDVLVSGAHEEDEHGGAHETTGANAVVQEEEAEEDEAAITVSLIEFNPFGAHLGSGAALFHWMRDWDALHSTDVEDGADEERAVAVRVTCFHSPGDSQGEEGRVACVNHRHETIAGLRVAECDSAY